MEAFDEEQLGRKLEISYAAVDLYAEKGDTFTLHELADRVDADVADIFYYFPNKESVLCFFYDSLVIRYRMMVDEIDDFGTYTLSEKLSNFIFTSFDMLAEKQTFVEASWQKLVRKSYSCADYEKAIEKLFSDFLENDPGISVSSMLIDRPFFHRLMVNRYLALVDFWLQDESEDKELTIEFTDKLTSLLQEVLYSSVADKTFDLLKFIYANNIWCRQIPFWDKISSKIEIR